MKVNKEEKEFPILLAYEDDNNRLHVWCPHCVDWHHHGEGEGHRIAHCTNQDSPFKEKGYVIKKGTKKDYNFGL